MLTLQKTHTATIMIDDEPVRVHVKRLIKPEAVAFEKGFFQHGQPRGADETSTDDERRAAARTFIEDSIAAYVTAEEGDIVDDGRPVVSGEDVIRTFCARGDILAAFYQLVYSQNFLGKAQKTILSGLPFLSPGSRLDSDGPVSPTVAETSNPADARREETPGDNAESSTAKIH